MKRFGVFACIAIFLIGIFVSPIFAQETDLGQNSVPAGELSDGTQALLGENAPPPTSAPTETVGGAKECGVFGPSSSIIKCIDEGVSWIIKNTLLQIAGFLLWLSAQMLNYAIQISVLDFAKWAPDSLYPIWLVIRQIVSLAVVFAGLWLGFMYIIGREDTFGKYVGWLVIFALFVNFSYPVTRALVDVSNIISLNVYTAAVGTDPLTGSTNSTAGGLIMNKLGLQGLVASATAVDGGQAGFIKQINSVPAALIAVVFVLYAAYIFLMATGIITIRAVLLVFLIVASPLLLVDSVIPKLGDAAMKLRKFFFQQLAVAPVFMIMLALTLKFLDIFSATGAISSLNANQALQSSGDGAVTTFFSILIMLIMLHIMIKVTKEVGGAAGEFATNAMGKVGGFGLGLASGGAGLLARGSIGATAARWRESDWMKNKQDTKLGRGLYTLSNSLAQSTFDTRNIGLVSGGMQRAGLTSIGGVGMQKGLVQNYDERFKSRDQEMKKRAAYIKDAGVRERFLEQKTKTVGAVAQKAFLGTVGRATGLKGAELRNDAEIIRDKMNKDRQKIKERYESFQDKDRQRQFLESQSDDIQEFLTGQKRPQPGTAQTPNPATNQAQKPNLDTSELDKAGFSSPQQATASTTTINPNESFAQKRRAAAEAARQNMNQNNTGNSAPPASPAPENPATGPKPQTPSPATAAAAA